MAIKGLGLLVEKVPVQQLGEAAVEILLRHALGEAKAQDDFIGELLVALHRPKIPLASHLLLQQPLHLSETPSPTLPKQVKWAVLVGQEVGSESSGELAL